MSNKCYINDFSAYLLSFTSCSYLSSIHFTIKAHTRKFDECIFNVIYGRMFLCMHFNQKYISHSHV